MKEVQDRVVQFSNRYKLTNAETGEVLGTFDFDEVTGTVQQVGTEIDAELFQSIADDLAARVVSAGGELAGTIVTFSDISGTAENVASGEKSSTLWGKVKNWFSRLKALAFKSKIAAGDIEAGAISDADISTSAEISQDKISGLKNDYAASIEITGRTVILKNKNGEEIGRGTTQDTTYGNATTEQSGLMSAEDKKNLDGLKSDFGAFKEDQTQTNAENEEKFSGIDTEFEKVNSELEKVNSNFVESETQTDAFIHGENTLKDVMASVEVQSKNLADLSKNPITGGNATIVERTDNSITFRVDESITSLYQGFSLDGITEGEITASAEWVTSGSGDPALALWWRYNRTFSNEGLVAFTKTSGGAITAKLKKPTEDAVLYIMLYVTRDIPAVIGDTTTFTNVLVERGNTKTSWTPYLPAGTPVNITACGKNLFDETKSEPLKIGLSLTVNEDKTINYKGTPDATYSYPDVNYRFRIPVLKSGTIPILYTTWENAPTSVVSIVLYGKDKTTLVGNFNSVTNTGWQEAQARLTDDAYYAGLFFGRLTAGTPTEINNIRLALVADSSIPSEPYPTYQGQDYSSQVGQTVYVVQYDKVTNIFATTEGGAVSTKFIKSIKDELNTKVVSLSGNFSKRPTGTYPYVILYTATNKFDEDRFTRLEANTDGSVSSNWVNISSAGGTGGGFTPRGEWNSATTYNENDLVSLNGSSYICIEENTNATPASNPDKWMVNAEKGATGATGATGTTGPAGTDGHSVYTATDTCSAEVGVECEVYKDSTNAKGVGDVIINASGRVFTVTGEDVHEGKPTWAGPVTAIINGPQGPAGANGTNGKDYLIYIGDTLTGTSGPNNYSGIIPVDDFNRVPATDEYFTALYKQTLTSGSQLSYCLLQVATASDSGALCQVTKAELLNAPKYIHHIRYTNGSDIVYFTYINDSSDNYTATNDMYLLTTELANKQLDVKERSLMANGIVGGKTIIAVYGEADGVIWGVPTSGEDVAFTKANCKIDDLTIKL